jgi:hypothetical protein
MTKNTTARDPHTITIDRCSHATSRPRLLLHDIMEGRRTGTQKQGASRWWRTCHYPNLLIIVIVVTQIATPPTPTFSSGLNKHQNDAPKGKDDTRDFPGPSLGRATMPLRREWCPYASSLTFRLPAEDKALARIWPTPQNGPHANSQTQI